MGSSGSSDEGTKKSKKGGFRIGGGVGGGLLSTYLSQKGITDSNDYIPSSMKASTLLEQVASERNWSNQLIQSDLLILEKNRLFTVSDLRVLSKESWKAIELLPIVKDLLQSKIYKDKKKAKKMKKKYRPDSSDSSCDEKEVNEIGIANIKINGEKTNGTAEKIKPLSIIPEGNMIKVATSDGKVYKANRYCPHKGVDLATRGRVNGNTLICTKHDWSFDLKNGGSCSNKPGNSIRACEINDW